MTAHTNTPPRPRRFRLGLAGAYFLLPLAVFAFTSIPGVTRLTPLLALALVALLLTVHFLPKVSRHLRIILWTLLVLSLVGSTGWFFSPFFFALYLLGIGLGFLYAPAVAVAFTLALIVMFASSIGEVSPTADFLTLLSLFSVIPITILLRKSFLLVQQEKKGILILESDSPETGITSLDAILANRVNRLGILLRQPVTYVRQGLALLEEGKLSDQEYQETLPRMIRAAEDAFTLVKEFESGATKNVLVGRKGPGAASSLRAKRSNPTAFAKASGGVPPGVQTSDEIASSSPAAPPRNDGRSRSSHSAP